MKYFIHKTLGPIIFSSDLEHAKVAKILDCKEDIESAGCFFAFVEGGNVRDGSMTLNLPKVIEDKQPLLAVLNS